MKYFFLVGEASADLHTSHLIGTLHQQEPAATFVGFGGDLMEEAGCTILHHYREMAFMGIAAVLKNWRKVRRNFRLAKEALLREQPDVLFLVDYPSFNLRMGDFCRKHLPKTKIIYYIPPKVWAWKRWRVHKIGRLCDEIWGIFPFEPAFYARYGYTCRYVGNPTFEELSDLGVGAVLDRGREGADILLVPGSRPHEIAHCLPRMIHAAKQVTRELDAPANIVIAGAPGVEPAFYAHLAEGLPVVFGATHELMQSARAAVVNSGTATLEAAILRCPQVAVYHVGCPAWLEKLLRRWLFPKGFFFTLPNIILGEEVVQECIGYRFREENVAQELSRLLTDAAYCAAQQQAYDAIRIRLSVSQ